MIKHQVTVSDIKKMEEEIEHRKLVVRKEALEAVKEARAQGDLSENFEYYAAKQYKNKNESRIRYLERYIRNAEVISDQSAMDEVGLNKTVELYFEDEDETGEFPGQPDQYRVSSGPGHPRPYMWRPCPCRDKTGDRVLCGDPQHPGM